ncbi:MAG TPA: hypothetical protein PLV81_14855 [Spirochaetota bacterium]|nr:hypothetical protein [Spirochaetota bacterium]
MLSHITMPTSHNVQQIFSTINVKTFMTHSLILIVLCAVLIAIQQSQQLYTVSMMWQFLQFFYGSTFAFEYTYSYCKPRHQCNIPLETFQPMITRHYRRYTIPNAK